MNSALTYLWLALLKRRLLHFGRGLRRPGTLVGFAAVASLVGFFFYHRHHPIVERLLEQRSWIGFMLIMLGGSLFKGFLQRGLVFEPPDIEFLFTSPFTQRQIVFYRLLPDYLYSVVQGLVFLALFESHLQNPIATTVCLILFQIACFHLAAGAAIFAGTISESLHHRIRWMMLGAYFLIASTYLHVVFDIRIVPAFVSAPVFQLFFYPAITLSEIGGGLSVGEWAQRLIQGYSFSAEELWRQTLYVVGFGAGAAVSLWLLLQLKANIFETSLGATAIAAEKRLRVRQGRQIVIESQPQQSVRLPRLSFFHGAGAIVWKNLVIAWRSKRELVMSLAFSLVYIALLFVFLRYFHDQRIRSGQTTTDDIFKSFSISTLSWLFILVFFLQRRFSFDFRRDGFHLAGFRTLPVSPFALALAEIAVPTVFCLTIQALGVVILMYYARPEVLSLLTLLLAFPAIALAINSVWNVHYLTSATKRAGGKAEASAAGTLLVVALSFMVCFPAVWTRLFVVRHMDGRADQVAFAVALLVQYAVDFLLVLALARLFQRFEVSRDFQ